MLQKSYDEWIDLENTEKERTYHYPDGFNYTIIGPCKLYIKKSGSHKIVDAKGRCHYISAGWRTFSFDGVFDFNVE